jgi:amino acid transporter
MTAAGMLAAFSTFNALVMSLSRLPYAMARDGYLPKIFARENSAGAPWVAIVVCSLLWGMAMGLGFERTVILDVLLTGLSILLEFVALIVLRMKEPELPRPFRVPFGGVGLALVSVPPAVLIVISCVRSRSEQIGPVSALMVGVVLIALGVVGYYAGPGRKLPA